MTFGDVLAQSFESKNWFWIDMDWKRTARFALIGCFVMGPMSGCSRIIGGKFNTAKDPSLILKRLMPLDYFVALPTINAVSIGSIAVLQNQNIQAKIQNEFLGIYMPVCIVQMSLFAFTFFLVRPSKWFAVESFVAPFWYSYFSHKCNKSIEN